jgi:type II secretory pathway pseudopilin PulG
MRGMDAAEETRAPGLRPSREWIGKAVFEAVLIVLGLLAALVVDGWRDARERSQRTQAALASIRQELEANRSAIAEAIGNYKEVMAALKESARTGRRYERGILRPSTPLSSVAWEAARDAAITNDMDHATLMTLGRVYGTLEGYRAEVRLFSNYLYTSGPPLRDTPERIEGWMNDLTLRAREVSDALGETLRILTRPE